MSNHPPTAEHSASLCPNGHSLVAVEESLPGHAPTDYDVEIGTGREYLTRYWRCRTCGQERNRQDEFTEPCEDEPTSLLVDGGYSVEDGRTRRALTEQMEIEYGERGPRYAVESQSGHAYEVDVEHGTCTCPDHAKRLVECKHLRRVALEILAGRLPDTDGRFRR
ncbi:hypothetical protein [Halospeciosus flavus]|nr:hypothetical protein [Halospeciosus flavus]